MRVTLKQDFFGPGGVYYQRGPLGTEVPDKLCEIDPKTGHFQGLPPGTKMFGKAPAPKPVEQTLKDFDTLRAEGVAADAAIAAIAPVSSSTEIRSLFLAAGHPKPQ